MYLTDFSLIDPPCFYSQEDALKWTLKLHCQAQKNKDPGFEENIERLIQAVCCKKERIHTRYFVSDDFCKKNGLADFGQRSAFYAKITEEVFERFYSEDAAAPADLIHVTCTGYNAPSSAQRLVIKKGWKETVVTHAYHMGCMAAVPAIRIAKGFFQAGKQKIDIVHTELCSLHFNPTFHTAEQLVAQSLFADGFIKYSLSLTSKNGFEILATEEELIPDTQELMKWECESWGLKMTLSKEIPRSIVESLPAFIKKLEQRAGISFDEAIYSIHPGGPKIIDSIKQKLNLKTKQVEASEKILYNRGNMSSATLPTIWKEILSDSMYPSGSVVVGLAFGPGLCMCGIVLRKKVLQ